MSAGEVAAGVLLALGMACLGLGCLGVVVMRDPYDRLHYLAPASYGTALVSMAVFLRYGWSLMGNFAIATAVVVIATGTVLGHVTMRSARVREHGDWRVQGGEDVEVVEP